jgi:hypothetical protein
MAGPVLNNVDMHSLKDAPGPTPVPPEAIERALQRLQRLAHWSDDLFRIPGTRLRFGLQPVIGAFPVVGDVLGLLLTAYLVQQAWVLRAPRRLLWRMSGNALLDFVIGLVPGVGDLADAAFKANRRNVRLLEAHLRERLPPPMPARRGPGRWVWAALVLAGLLLLALLWRWGPSLIDPLGLLP